MVHKGMDGVGQHGVRFETPTSHAMPRISVILPVHNGMPYLPFAVESILQQTFPDFELIIIDDASTDSTSEYLANLSDRRVRVSRNQQNLGVSPTLNRALRLARGEYIARQDADDLSVPRRLELQAEFLRTHPQVDLVGSPAVVINDSGEDTGVWEVPWTDIDIKWELVFGNPFVHTSVMLRRATLERVGTYSEDRGCAHVEDYDLWLRLAATSVLANLQAAVVRWRERVGSVSCKNQCRQSEQRESLSIASVQELLRPGNLHPRDWLAFKKLVRGSPREPINLDSSEVSRGLRAAQQIQQAFYRRYRFTPDILKAHRHRCAWLWGKHMLALACRNNGSRDLACRVTLLTEGMKLLSGAGWGYVTRS